MAHRPTLALYLFANKALLEHSDICWFKCCLWLLSCYKVQLNSCERDCIAHKAKKIYYLDLCRKSLLTSPLVHLRESDGEAVGKGSFVVCKTGPCLMLRPPPPSNAAAPSYPWLCSTVLWILLPPEEGNQPLIARFSRPPCSMVYQSRKLPEPYSDSNYFLSKNTRGLSCLSQIQF